MTTVAPASHTEDRTVSVPANATTVAVLSSGDADLAFLTELLANTALETG
jgi:hypothetical protein